MPPAVSVSVDKGFKLRCHLGGKECIRVQRSGMGIAIMALFVSLSNHSFINAILFLQLWEGTPQTSLIIRYLHTLDRNFYKDQKVKTCLDL